MNPNWHYCSLGDAVFICDSLRKPINAHERNQRILGKPQDSLFPYYGATGQVGYIDGYLTDGEYVLLGEDGAPFLDAYAPKAYLIQGKSWVNNHAHILKSKSDNKFLCYYLNYFNYKNYVTGTTRLKLTQAEMKKIPVPCPSLTEQQRIVSKIEELFSELDNSVAALNRTQQQLRSYQQSVINSYFADSNKLVISTLGEYISSIESGKSFKCIETPPQTGECGIIKVSAVTWGEFNENESKTCKTDQFISKRAIHKGDFLFSRANTLQLIGNCVIVKHIEKELMLSDKILRFNFTDNIHPLYMLYFLRSQMGKSQIRTLSSGNQDGMRNIGQERIKKIQFPVRTKEEQLQIASSIEAKLSACKKIEATISQTLKQAESLRQSILKQAFEGKLV